MAYADVLKQIITKRREELGYSQRDLAQRAKLSNVTISDLERGEVRDPKISTLQGLARALDLDITLLLMGRADMSQPAWPLRTSRGQIESLAEPYRSLLDTLIAAFVRECGRIADNEIR